MKRAYLSRESGQSPNLENALRQKGFIIDCQSQVERSIIPIPNKLPEFDWLFFSSPFAVGAFFEQNPDLGNTRIAALGKGTAEAIEKYHSVDFVGQSSNTDIVAQSFKKLIGEDIVLFPSPEKGMRKVQNALLPEQVREVICYSTSPSPKKIDEADVYLFSSPSNVKAFAKLNHFPNKAVYYAFGKSSAAALEESGVKNIELTRTYDEKVLIQAIFSKFAC